MHEQIQLDCPQVTGACKINLPKIPRSDLTFFSDFEFPDQAGDFDGWTI